MNHSWWIPIDKLTYWRTETWVRYEAKSYNLSLHIHCDQLLILNDNKLLESLNMNGKIKGVYKGDVLILIFSTGLEEIRKIKFQIRCNANECFEKLSKHFVVVSHGSSSKGAHEKYNDIDKVFSTILDECGRKGESGNNVPIPSNFDNFIKLCLLDPAFPSFVQKTKNIIDSEILKN